MANMGIDALRARLTNPARIYLWEVEFTSPVGGDNRDALKIQCQSTSKPGRSVGRIHVPFKGTGGVNFPGKVTFSHEWPCTFVENSVDLAIGKALHGWQQAMMDARTGQGGLDVDVKSDVYLRLLDQTNAVISTIKLVGCFVQTVDDVALTFEDESVLIYNTTWAYDYWEE